MVSCVASVEVQLRVVESPVLMEVGLACSETVGRAAAGGGGGGGGGAFGTGFLQPATKASARMALSMAPRYRELETRIIRILLNVRIPFWSHQRQHPITSGLGKGKYIVSRYITHRTQTDAIETGEKQQQKRVSKRKWQPTLVMRAADRKIRRIYSPWFYLGDQLGDSLWPSTVSWWGCEPSASMVQIWRGPVRVDSKTIWRPSGAQLGRSLREPESGVRLKIFCEVGSIT